MKLMKLEQLPREVQTEVSFLVGMYQGQPLVLAKKEKGCERWTLYRNRCHGSSSENKYEKIATISSLENVLALFQKKNLTPLCNKPISSKKNSSSGYPTYIEQKKWKRKHFRKSATLYGYYFNYRTKSSGEFRSQDISFMGLRLITTKAHDIEIEDKLFLSFILDNSKNSTIRRKAEVKHISGKKVGVQFIHLPSYDKDLGFYLYYT